MRLESCTVIFLDLSVSYLVVCVKVNVSINVEIKSGNCRALTWHGSGMVDLFYLFQLCTLSKANTRNVSRLARMLWM